MSTTLDIQHALNSKGFGPLTEDGISGPLTVAAIKAFQQANNLTVDGLVGPQTGAALGLSSAAPPVNHSTITLTTTSAPAISGIKQSVVDAFASFSTHFEGYTPFMYTDSKGLVTTGIGNLIDNGSSSPAQGLQWQKPDGSLASSAEIDDAWRTVKNAFPGTQSVACQSLTNLRLTQAGIAKLVNDKMRSNHASLVSQYPQYPLWPADGQMAIHSISWAWGSAFAKVWGANGTAFLAAANSVRPDFAKMSAIMKTASGHEETINPGIIPRDAANDELFSNAATAIASGLDFNKLFYPNIATKVAIGFGLGTAITGIVGLITYFGYNYFSKR